MRSLALLLVLSSLIAACGDEPATGTTATGAVIDVEGDLSGVETFTVLTTEGDELTFVPDEGLLFDDGPLSHLQSHMTSGAPVEVTYEERDGALVAVHITDAH